MPLRPFSCRPAHCPGAYRSLAQQGLGRPPVRGKRPERQRHEARLLFCRRPAEERGKRKEKRGKREESRGAREYNCAILNTLTTPDPPFLALTTSSHCLASSRHTEFLSPLPLLALSIPTYLFTEAPMAATTALLCSSASSARTESSRLPWSDMMAMRRLSSAATSSWRETTVFSACVTATVASFSSERHCRIVPSAMRISACSCSCSRFKSSRRCRSLRSSAPTFSSAAAFSFFFPDLSLASAAMRVARSSASRSALALASLSCDPSCSVREADEERQRSEDSKRG